MRISRFSRARSDKALASFLRVQEQINGPFRRLDGAAWHNAYVDHCKTPRGQVLLRRWHLLLRARRVLAEAVCAQEALWRAAHARQFIDSFSR